MSETREEGEGAPRATCGTCYCAGVGPAVSEWIRRMGPPEAAREHFDRARVELLKGIRALVDARIADLSKTPEKGAKVPVE